MAENKSLLDTNEEEQVSLVHNSSTSEEEQATSTLIDTSRAINDETTEEDWEHVDTKEDQEKEHPLATLSLEDDPWANKQDEREEEEEEEDDEVEDLIVQQNSVATTPVIDVDNQQPQSNAKEILDEDTSAVKVKPTYTHTCLDIKLFNRGFKISKIVIKSMI